MLNFTTPLSALRANAVALDVVAHNIGNANTEGYVRQAVNFSERPSIFISGYRVGQGVNVADIRNLNDMFTERAINQNTSDAAAIEAQLEVATDIESILAGPGSISNRLGRFFDQLEQFTAQPDNAGSQAIVIQAATSLAGEINSLASQLDGILASLDQQIQSSLDRVHELSTQLVDLNKKIAVAEAQGQAPLDLINRRNEALKTLSREIDVEMMTARGIDELNPAVSFQLVNGQLSFGHSPPTLFTERIGEEIAIVPAGATRPLDIQTGRIGGLLQARNTMVREYMQRFEAFATSFVAAVDAAHATGVGAQGGFTHLIGHRSLTDAEAPLGGSGTIVPIQAGSLFITVTNEADGSKTLHEVLIDPSQRLPDVAAAISGIDHLQAVTNPRFDQLSLLAEPGFTFDFTGGVPTLGTTNNITGSAEIRFSGSYTGDHNGEIYFHVSGSGTVGVDEGLTLEARDEVGALLGSFQVGQGYEPGSKIAVGDGMMLEIASGTVNDADSFSSIAIAQPDQTGLLVALGMNTLFSGQNAASLRISDDLVRDPLLLATTRTGQPRDTRNAQALLGLRAQGVLGNNGTQSFEVFLANEVAVIGAEVNGLSQFRDSFEVVNQSLQAKRQSVVGVDQNEEIVHMLQFQRAFQSAARYVSAIDESLQELFNILR